jgi:glycine cleavage system H protein
MAHTIAPLHPRRTSGLGSTATSVTVGITKFAADQLTDVTFIELPAVGKAVKAKRGVREHRNRQAVSPLYSPVTGRSSQPTQGWRRTPTASRRIRTASAGW